MKKKETSSRVDTVTVPISLVVRCVSSDSVVGAPLQHFGKIVYHTLPVSFGLDVSRWSVLSGVYARGSKSFMQG